MGIKKGSEYEKLVGEIACSLYKNAKVKCTQWIKGPDGRRDMDVLIEGVFDGKESRIIIECKDFDLSKTGKVGIPFVDALDSKRQDLNTNYAIICSNSGFKIGRASCRERV